MEITLCSLFLGLFCSIRLIPHAVKPINKTGEIGPFFFFIHILVCSDYGGCETAFLKFRETRIILNFVKFRGNKIVEFREILS